MGPSKGGQAGKQASAAPGNAKKPQQQAKKKPAAASSRPPVVPAIPLPYVHRQTNSMQQSTAQRNSAAPLVVSSNGQYPAASLEAALAGNAGQHQRQRSHANGAYEAGADKAEIAAVANGHVRNDENKQNGQAPEQHIHQQHYENGQYPNGSHGDRGHANGVTVASDGHEMPASSTQVSTAPSVAGDGESMAGSVWYGSQGADHDYQASQPTSASASQPQSATMASFRPVEFLPSFHVPTNGHNAYHMTPRVDPIANLMNHGRPAHKPQFGFDSHTPSPSHANGAFLPPMPPVTNGHIQQANGVNGRHSHTNSLSTELPIPIHAQPLPRPDMTPTSSADVYAQLPAAARHVAGPFDGYPNEMGFHGSMTPRSLHGSHASGEFNGGENGRVAFPYANGNHYHSHSHHDLRDPHGVNHLPPFPGPGPFPHHPNMPLYGELDPLVSYVQQQFNSAESSDCVLELSMKNDQQFKIHGHKFIFARSPALKNDLKQAEAHLRESGQTAKYITVTPDDSFLRPDAWDMAVRRLYAYPLFAPPPVDRRLTGAEFAGGLVDQFRFCLGYAAAGYHLCLDDVRVRGLETAAGLLTWETVEEGLSYVFDGGDREMNYDGPEINILLNLIIRFLIDSFPSDFELDTTVADPSTFARVPSASTPPPDSDQAAPAIARGTIKPSKSRLNIRFGDLPTALPDDEAIPPREPARCSPQLSRILLNLPFTELCAVLTPAPPQARFGYHTAQQRFQAVKAVLAEREARRLRAVEAVRQGQFRDAKEIQYRLSASTPHPSEVMWDRLNWSESIDYQNGANGLGALRITRTWVPQFSDPFEADTDQDSVPLVPSESMV